MMAAGADPLLKLGVITPIPTPYRDPFWEAVSRQPDVALTVYYCDGVSADRPWEMTWSMSYPSEILPGYNLQAWRRKGIRMMWNPGIQQRLRSGGFDALVVGGYNHPTMLATIRFARRNQVPYFLMSESHLHQPRSAWRKYIKRSLVSRIVSGAAGGFPTGRLAGDYLAHYGMDEARLAYVPNIPDVNGLAEQAKSLRIQRNELRAERGLDDSPVVLFLGRLIPKKRVDLLLRAFASACGTGSNAQFLIGGDGFEREGLERLAVELGLQDRVRFLGFVQPEEVPKFYAMADVFVLPSSETWGVVVLEALASGLPVIVTDEVGCHADVVIDSVVGDVVRAGSLPDLAEALRRRFENRIAPEIVEKHWESVRQALGYEQQASQFVAHVRHWASREVPSGRLGSHGEESGGPQPRERFANSTTSLSGTEDVSPEHACSRYGICR